MGAHFAVQFEVTEGSEPFLAPLAERFGAVHGCQVALGCEDVFAPLVADGAERAVA